MAAIIALLFVLAALGTALLPLLSEESAERAGDSRRAALEAERDELIAGLRDAELDLAMGKITVEDHDELRRSLEDRAVAVLARIDALEVPPGTESDRR